MDFCVCYDGIPFCAACIDTYTASRAESDARDPMAVLEDAYAEGYARDWAEAINDHDWFCNQCDGIDAARGERCRNRRGHRGKHDASINGVMQFCYSEERVNALVYKDNPLLKLVRP